MKRFRKILVHVDGDDGGAEALARAVDLADRNRGTITVVSVMRPPSELFGLPLDGPTIGSLQAALREQREVHVAHMVEPHRSRVDLQVKLLEGTPFLEVIREVVRGGHDLVIKPPEDVEWVDRILGSDDMHLLRKCPCPVWMNKATAPRRYRAILAAVDVDQGDTVATSNAKHALNRLILELASSLAESMRAELHVAHVWSAPNEDDMRSGLVQLTEDQVDAYVSGVRDDRQQRLDDLLAELRSAKPGQGEIEQHLIKGVPEKVIPLIARLAEIDLLVMGTVARTGVPGLIVGNTAEMILSQISCSVLAVKPPGFVTPVQAKDE